MPNTNNKIDKIWLPFKPTIPCNPEGCNKHYACHLWETGWRVSMRKFWFIKWLEFTRERTTNEHK